MQLRMRQAGFGLVELMVGILVGMIVVSAAVSMLTTTLASSNSNIQMSRLDQELRQVMTMLSRDLRRATIWDPAVEVALVSITGPLTLSAVSGNVTVSSTAGNLDDIGAKAVGGTLVYTSGGTLYQGSITAFDSGTNSYSVTIGTAWPTTAATTDGVPAGAWSILRPESTLTQSGTCILFAYDLDASGTYANSERFGYRYDATDKAVEIHTSGDSTDTCTSGGSWENLTDDSTVEITAFSVTDNSPPTVTNSGLTIAVREFTVSITARLKSDTSVVRTLQETIRVRNDRLS
jgi:type II secretory pathway component PulJ